MTRKALVERLRAFGLDEAGVEAVARAGARARHEARVAAALEAARLEAEDDAGNCTAASLAAAAWAYLAVEVGPGLGGAGGVTGGGTRRSPAFAALGTGRRQARDGGAWSAAIAEAEATARRLAVRECGDPVALGPGVAGVEVRCGERPLAALDLPPEWVRAIALRAVARLAGGVVPEPAPAPAWERVTGDPAEWAAVARLAAPATPEEE